MMTGGGLDIDLYTDDIGEEDGHADGDGFQSVDGVDLYGDVLTADGRSDGDDGSGTFDDNYGFPPTSGTPPRHRSFNDKVSTTPGGSSGITSSDTLSRKHQVYVGNLTWYTTDQDILDCLDKIGVHDLLEVKFFESRVNGQSKGFCVLTVGSEVSIKIIYEQLAKYEINKIVPVAAPPTKQSMNQFEAQAKTRPLPAIVGQGQQNNNNGGGSEKNGPPNMNIRGPMPGMGLGGNLRMMMPAPVRGGIRGMGPPHLHMSGHGGSSYNILSPRGMRPPNHGGYGHRQMSTQNLPPIPGGPSQPMPMMYPDPFYLNGLQHLAPRGPPGVMDPRGPFPRRPGPGDWRPVNYYAPPGQSPMNTPGNHPGSIGRVQGYSTLTPPGVTPSPAPHMNPAFFHPVQNGSPSRTPAPVLFNIPPPVAPVYPPKIDRRSPSMSEAEFEEVMFRNKSVSKSAISRVVSDAATGEFASAIETLETAISLIKKSKVAKDDRCKILVSSLQDTLIGIERKSHGIKRERSRSRERQRQIFREKTRSYQQEAYSERSRDRYFVHPRERSRSREHRDRERSRSREHRERSHSREHRERPPREEIARVARACYDEACCLHDRVEREPRARFVEERSRDRELDSERRSISSRRTPRY